MRKSKYTASVDIHKTRHKKLVIQNRMRQERSESARQRRTALYESDHHHQQHSSGAVWESRWPSWAVRPNEPSGYRGRKDLLNRASALVSACPWYVSRHSRTLSNTSSPTRSPPLISLKASVDVKHHVHLTTTNKTLAGHCAGRALYNQPAVTKGQLAESRLMYCS